LRIDTHKGNTVMRKMLEKHGFSHCGTIFLHSGESRVAYEKRI
jgi:RimJ/RimL family protein N-acetyltransferase